MHIYDRLDGTNKSLKSGSGRKALAAGMLAILAMLTIGGTVCQAREQVGDNSKGAARHQTPGVRTESIQRPFLRRAQFTIEGAGCVTCIRRIASVFGMQAGVAGVSLPVQRPLVATVIYDPSEIDLQRILRIASDGKYGITGLTDTPADRPSEVIIPRQGEVLKSFSNLPDLQGPALEMP